MMGEDEASGRGAGGIVPRLAAWLKDPGSLRRWGPIAVIVLIGLFYHDWLIGRAFVWDDLLYLWYPALCHQAEALQHGRLALWNPGLRCGMSFISDVQVGAFYLPHWLISMVSTDGRIPWLAYQWYLVGHVVVAVIGTYLFLRDQKLGAGACATGALVFGLSGFMSMHVIHAPFLCSIAWIPLAAFWMGRAATRGRPSLLLGAWLAITLSFLSGAPQITLYASFFLVTYWGFLVWRGAGLAGAGRAAWVRLVAGAGSQLVVLYALVLLAGAAMALPSFTDWSGSPRSGFGFAEVADNSVPPYYWLTLAFPNFFGVWGASGEGVPHWGFNQDSIEVRVWGKAPWQYCEFAAYVGQLGIVALAFAAIGWRRAAKSPEIRFFLIWALFALWFMMGRYGGLFQVLYHVVPGVAMFRSPCRMSWALCFASAVLVAHVVDAVLRGQDRRLVERISKIGALVCGGVLLLFLTTGGSWAKALGDAGNFDNAGFEIARAAVFLGLLFWWARGVRKGRLSGTAAQWIPACLVFLDLYLAHSHFHVGRVNPSEYFADRAGVMPRLREVRAKGGPFRLAQLRDGKLSEEIVFPRNAAFLYPDLEVPEGYVTFTPKRVNEFLGMRNEAAKLAILNARVMASVSGGRLAMGLNTNALPRAQVYHRGEAFESWPEVRSALEDGRLDYRSHLGWIRGEADEAEGILGGGPESPDAVEMEVIAPEKMRLRTRMAAPGAIFVSQSYYRGWRARDASGESLRVVPAFGAFTAILVPRAGDTDILFEYWPGEFGAGLWLSAAGLAGACGLWWVARRREARGSKTACCPEGEAGTIAGPPG